MRTDPLLSDISGTALAHDVPWAAATAVRHAGLILQLGLVVLLIGRLRIESAAFSQLAILALAGFVVHSFLAPARRLPFFLLLSVAGLWLVVGMAGMAWILAVGLSLIGIAHLPLRVWTRAGLLAVAGLALALARASWPGQPGSLRAAMPIIGSLFMFRLAIYMYDREHEKPRQGECRIETASRALSYFFLLPNVCFPFFPVVDYATYRKTYYNGEPLEIYQRGVNRILAGILQILFARLVYHYVAIDPAEVVTKTGVLRYLVADFLLYMKIAGQFDLCIGLLHLFGFNLPKTNHWFYFSSGFLDFWRRGNIYWKNFMMKMIYYPVYFKARKMGHAPGIVVSIIAVFFCTMLLHAYQWFWIRGDFSLVWTDVLMWGILCALVVMGSLAQLRPCRAPRTAHGRVIRRGLAMIGTFALMSVLFSMWSSRSLSLWVSTVTMGKVVVGKGQ